MMTEKDDFKKEADGENPSLKQNENRDQNPLTVPNPFEPGHKEISPETLDSIEQFKEAQTERD